ncbi:MAG: class I SAM-dependent methyltransferase, partial [Pseudolabrys sp.]
MKNYSLRKTEILATSERNAAGREEFWRRAEFFHEEDLRYLRFLIPEGLRVLELGCGIGNTLAGLKPSFGLGVDFSPAMIEQARRLHPDLQFEVGDVEDPEFLASLPGPFDVILVVDTIGSLDDCQAMFEALHGLCSRETRLVVVYYSHLWDPLIRLAEWIRWRARQPEQNVFSPADIHALAGLSDFEVIKAECRLLSPLRLLGIGSLINR